MSIPKENRQQMINLMYLVLTALLALNVSSEILKAFQTINTSLENSNTIADNNIKTTFKGFAEKRAKEPTNEQVQKFEALANQAMTMSTTLLSEISNVKQGLIKEAGGPGEEGAILERMDDIDVSTRYLVEGEKQTTNKGGKGYELEAKINSTLASFMSMVDTSFKAKIASQITLNTTSTTKGKDWVNEQFYQMPAIASYTMLTKLENDVKSAENTMIRYFFSRIGSADELKEDQIVLDQFSAQVASPSAYVLSGETFEANVFLAASSSESSVSVSVNGSSLPVKDGVGTYKVSAGGVGEHPLSGVVSVKNNRTGKVTQYKTPEFKYTVAAPFATVSATATNVFYIGVDNPVEVSAAGMRLQDVSASMTAGSLVSKGPGQYIARVTTQGKTNVNVTAKGKSFGSKEFRCKMIPDPIAAVGNQSGGRVNAGWWKAQKGVQAMLKDFLFEVGFQVLSFNMFYQPKLQDPGIAAASGAYFSASQAAFNAKAKPGDIFYIEDIKVKGPDGLTRKIPGIAFKID